MTKKTDTIPSTPTSANAHSMPTSDVIELMNDLTECCKDGAAGYEKASRDADSLSLKGVFTRLSEERGQFATELQAEVSRLGGVPELRGTVAGAMHRGWNDVKSALGGRDDAAILVDCEHGEDTAKKNFDAAAAKHLPMTVHSIVSRQAEAVRIAHNEIRDLRDIAVPRTHG
mgnify:CR=1 FL=1